MEKGFISYSCFEIIGLFCTLKTNCTVTLNQNTVLVANKVTYSVELITVLIIKISNYKFLEGGGVMFQGQKM